MRKAKDRVIATATLPRTSVNAPPTVPKQRADEAGTALKRRHPDTRCDEKRQGIHCEREDRPAEQSDAECVENKPKGDHGGGSMCKDITVAPSTTTAAQLRP
ncbi:hypothetical protein [Bradyrhizobium sp. CB2312]|uniref:hypothetical protein n=1 Tax=Bradyrhizobium sp. CB2312 TaxID=3039155 RepID=UPI0032C2135F